MAQENEIVQAVQEKVNDLSEDAVNDAIIKGNIRIIRELRKRTDGLIHITRTVSSDSFEKINAVSSMLMLKGWFQDVLEYLGEPAINNKTLSSFHDIDVETDVSEGIKVQVKSVDKNGNETLTDANEVQSLNHVRNDMEYISNQVAQLATITDTIYETFIFQRLRETKFWLDRELFRIKHVANQKIFSKSSQGDRKLPSGLQRKSGFKRPDFTQGPARNAGEQRQSPLIVKKGGDKEVTDESQDKSSLKVDVKVEENDKAEGKTNS